MSRRRSTDAAWAWAARTKNRLALAREDAGTERPPSPAAVRHRRRRRARPGAPPTAARRATVTSVRQIDRPSPGRLPSWCGTAGTGVSTSSGKPTPQSSTPMRTSSCATDVVSVSARSPDGFDAMASHAFTIRLRRTCWSCTRSVSRRGKVAGVSFVTETPRAMRSLRVRRSRSSSVSFTLTGCSATWPRRSMVRRRSMIAAGATVGADDVREDGAHLGEVGRVLRHEALGRLGVAEDAGERLAQLVREGARERAQRWPRERDAPAPRAEAAPPPRPASGA